MTTTAATEPTPPPTAIAAESTISSPTPTEVKSEPSPPPLLPAAQNPPSSPNREMLSPSRSPSSPPAEQVSRKRPADDDVEEETPPQPTDNDGSPSTMLPRSPTPAIAAPRPPTPPAPASGPGSTKALSSPPQQHSAPPTKKVLERNQACLGCRARKRKCDGGKPSCGACERLERECQYTHNAVTKIHSSTHFRVSNGSKRKPSPAKRAAARSTSPIRSGTSPAPAVRVADAPSTGFTAVNSSLENNHPKTTTLNPGTPRPLSTLANGHYDRASATASRGMSPYGTSNMNGSSNSSDINSNIMHFFQMAPFPEFAIDFSSMSTDIEMTGADKLNVLPLDEDDLPSLNIKVEIFQTFFEKVHIFLPCLYTKQVMDSVRNSGELSKPNTLTYSILAIAGSLHPNALVREASNIWDMHAKRAFHTAVDSGLFSCLAVQAGIYTTLRMYTQGRLGEFWVFLGCVWRMCLTLGLHQLDRSENAFRNFMSLPKNEQELEERRRTMWAVYILDRLLSTSVNWTMNIIDDEFDVNFPASEDVFQCGSIGTASHMIVDPFPRSIEFLVPKRSEHAVHDLDSYQYLCKVAVLIGKINSYNRSLAQSDAVYASIDTTLTHFMFALPKTHSRGMADLPPNQLPTAFLLNVLLSTARIYLSHPRIPKDRRTDDDDAFEQCVSSARNILTHARRAGTALQTYDVALSNPFLPCPIWFAARILCIKLLDQRLDTPAPHDHNAASRMTKENMEILLQIVQRQEETWPRLGRKFSDMVLADVRRDPLELARIRSGTNGYYEKALSGMGNGGGHGGN